MKCHLNRKTGDGNQTINYKHKRLLCVVIINALCDNLNGNGLETGDHLYSRARKYTY